jgi:hypothetical protein
LSIPLGPLQIFTKNGEDICYFVFIAGVVDTSYMLFTSVNDTGDKLLPVSLLPDDKLIAGVVDNGD